MGAFSTYMETKIVEQFLRNNPTTPPATVYVALFESDPGVADTGTETNYTGYARQASAWTSLDSNAQTHNSGALTFPANGDSTTSHTITYIALFDSATGGNELLHAQLTAPKTLSPGDVLSFAAAAIVFGLS